MGLPRNRKGRVRIKNFYINNVLPEPEYMKLHINIIPQEIIDKYALHKIVDDNVWVYLEIVKGVYGSKTSISIMSSQNPNT